MWHKQGGWWLENMEIIGIFLSEESVRQLSDYSTKLFKNLIQSGPILAVYLLQ